jgi:predicted RND superfamily exporter protein
MFGWCFARHRAVLLIVLVLTAGGAGFLWRPGLQRDYTLEAFVARADPSYETFRSFMAEFRSNELALIAIETDDALSERSLGIQIEIIERIRPLVASGQVEHLGALAEIPPALRAVLGDRLPHHPLVDGNLLSHDGRTAAIVLQMHGEGVSGGERRRTVAALRSAVDQAQRAHPDARIVIAGPYVTLIDMYRYVDRDLVVFCGAAFALLMLTLGIVFRRFGPMVYAMTAALAAMCGALATAVLLALNVSLIVQMIVILVTVLTIANAVHLAVGGEESALREPGAPVTVLARHTLDRLGWPCVAVVATTVAGFASVTISNITPVRLFGWLMAWGLVLGLVLSLVLVPLVFAGGAGGLREGRRLRDGLRWVGAGSLRRYRTVMAVFGLAGLAALSGLPRLRFESDFVKNFRAGSEVRAAYEFIEKHLTPLGSLEVVVRSLDGRSIVTLENAERADALGRRIVADYPPIKKSMTVADLVTLGADTFPASEFDLQLRLGMATRLMGEDMLRNFVSADSSALRINLRAVEGYDVASKLRMAGEIERRAQAAFGEGYKASVTGLYYFYAQLVSGLIRDQYRSFALTVPIVFLMLVIVFRSVKIAALSMIPNLLPVVFCMGAMAWLAIPVNMTTAMMLSVTFGIAVDDTLHYFWRCRREFERCGRYPEAILAAHASVGRACLFTTVVIAGGFWILILSRFLPTAYFGGLVGFTMIGALAADLVLLPVIIVRSKPFGPEKPIR